MSAATIHQDQLAPYQMGFLARLYPSMRPRPGSQSSGAVTSRGLSPARLAPVTCHKGERATAAAAPWPSQPPQVATMGAPTRPAGPAVRAVAPAGRPSVCPASTAPARRASCGPSPRRAPAVASPCPAGGVPRARSPPGPPGGPTTAGSARGPRSGPCPARLAARPALAGRARAPRGGVVGACRRDPPPQSPRRVRPPAPAPPTSRAPWRLASASPSGPRRGPRGAAAGLAGAVDQCAVVAAAARARTGRHPTASA
jgi:hypothetical protein